MAKPKSIKTTGTLYYDRDDGWCLEGEKPNSGDRIKDLFHDFEGKEIEVTVRVVRAGRKASNRKS